MLEHDHLDHVLIVFARLYEPLPRSAAFPLKVAATVIVRARTAGMRTRWDHRSAEAQAVPGRTARVLLGGGHRAPRGVARRDGGAPRSAARRGGKRISRARASGATARRCRVSGGCSVRPRVDARAAGGDRRAAAGVSRRRTAPRHRGPLARRGRAPTVRHEGAEGRPRGPPSALSRKYASPRHLVEDRPRRAWRVDERLDLGATLRNEPRLRPLAEQAEPPLQLVQPRWA